MKAVYLFPFSYFFSTRLRDASVSFHFVFEWLAAAVLVVMLGKHDLSASLFTAFLCYVAFISLYEIGYIVNDLVAAKSEINGRMRGPQDASRFWILAWSLMRLATFLGITFFLNKLASAEWWSFFLALCLVFLLHNLLREKEWKVVTFIWLAWMRFMAPVLFVLEERFLVGVGFAASLSYVVFRLLGYMDSKGLLRMAGRKRSSFRIFFFLSGLSGVLVLWPYESARGFVILSSYFALASVTGAAIHAIVQRSSA